jgi:hypothetical protein
MGAAIECFEQSGAVLVPRSRFAPVKTTGDLLALRSDAYVVTPDERIELDSARRGVPPGIVLDDKHYKTLAGLESGFGSAAPSLKHCAHFEVKGPWHLEPGIVCRGEVCFLNESPAPAAAKAGVYADAVVRP